MKGFFYLFWILAFLESALRVQQALGPLYDLECRAVIFAPSETLSHAPLAGYERFDASGIQKTVYLPPSGSKADSLKILWMGDYFMYAFTSWPEVESHILSTLKQTPLSGNKIQILNAGVSAYSPAIYIPQAKKLIPEVKPDFVVINIDHTDISDDYGYKDLITRDPQGKIIAVKPTKYDLAVFSPFIKIRKQPIYLLKALMKFYHTRIYIPWLLRDHPPDRTLVLQDHGPHLDLKYQNEISFFTSNLKELTETLIQLMADKNRILYVCHPYPYHLVPDREGFYWNNFVPSIVQKVTQEYGVPFYDATYDLKLRYGEHPQQYYIAKDTHFNVEGLKCFAEKVVEVMAQKIAGLVENHK